MSRNLLAFAGASLLLGAAAFAGNITKRDLHLYESVSVQGKQLTPGDYKVEWSGTGPDVQVTILNGRDTVASVPAKVVPTDTKNNSDGYASAKQADGSSDLTSIFFHGERFELQVSQQAAATAQPGTSGSN